MRSTYVTRHILFFALLLPIVGVTASSCIKASLVSASKSSITGFEIVPSSKTLSTGNSFTFSASGGVSPYTYSVISGGGSIASTTGLYTAPGSAGSATVQVTDASGNTATATITIGAGISFSPSTARRVSVLSGDQLSFSGSGGVAPYSYYLNSGPGSISSGGVYTAGTTSGTAAVEVRDSLGNSSNLNIQNIHFRTNGKVNAIVKNGTSWYVGGSFTRVHPIEAKGLIILDESGNPETPCDISAGFDATVSAIALSGDSIYVGGGFVTYKGQDASYLAKLNLPGCDLDTTFSPPGANGFDGYVEDLIVSGTSLYAVGEFTEYRGVANSARRIAKLDLTTGELDTVFSPPGAAANGFNDDVNGFVASGTSLYVGGDFTQYRGVANSANYLAKLDLTTGALDTVFSPPGATANGFDDRVVAVIKSGSSLYVGGDFVAYKNVANSARALAKLDLTTGVIDTIFSPPGASTNGFNAAVEAFAVSSSALYVGGQFTAYKGVANSANYLAKLDLASGVIDTVFSPPGASSNGVDSFISTLAVSSTALYVGGGFNTYRGVSGLTTNLAKVDLSSGVLDTSFVPTGSNVGGMDAHVNQLLFNSGFLYVGGTFKSYGGQSANRIAKLDATTWELDTTFSPPGSNGFDEEVFSLAASGSSLYAGGFFLKYRGVSNSARRLAKLDLTTGAIDTVFSPIGSTANGFNGTVFALTTSGTSLYAGGGFTNYKNVANSARRIAKLDLTSGTIDTVFSPPGAATNGVDTNVKALAVSATSLYAGGEFTAYKGVANSANRLVKLDLTTGVQDTVFSPPGASANGFDNEVDALHVSGTDLYAGGLFNEYQGVANSANYLAKLNATTGVIDTVFSPVGATANGFDYQVNAITTSGTSVYIGGSFNEYRGVTDSALSIAKLDATTGNLDTVFNPQNGWGSNGFYYLVRSMVVSGTSLLVGGDFDAYRNSSAYHLVPIHVTTGDPIDP